MIISIPSLWNHVDVLHSKYISNFNSKESIMSIIKNYFLAFKDAGEFSGTSNHLEFWPFITINSVITIWYLLFAYYNELHYDVYTGHLLWFYLSISMPTFTLTIRYLRNLKLPSICVILLLLPLSALVYVSTYYIPALRFESFIN